MLTSRAWWFLVSVVLVLCLGLLRSSLPLTLLGLAALLWFGGQWLWFLHCLPTLGTLSLERELWDERTTVAALWAGQTFEVRLRLTSEKWVLSPHLAVVDHVPYAVTHRDGETAIQGVVHPEQPLEWAYRIQCGPAGVARFEGVRIRAADVQGFFYRVFFFHAVELLPILPVLLAAGGRTAGKKRHNLLLPPGIHRFRRPGSGSELLDLRDYVSGDPPKTIAWKVSARRDRLITKEFESEVPVRCTLFVDTSRSVRVPARSGKALDRLIDVAACVLQANSGIRDLTGLCLFDERGVVALAPGRGGAHRISCLRALAESAARLPEMERVDPEHLQPLASSFAQEVYPELLHPAINRVPIGMTWLEGFSGHVRRLRLGWLELAHRKKMELRSLSWWASFWALVLPLGLFLVRAFFKTRSLDTLLYVAFLLPFLSLFLWFGTLFVFTVDAVTGRAKRRRDRWRKRLAALVSARYGLAPGGLATLLEDDDAFALLLQRFLSEHQVPYVLPLYSPQGRYLFAAPEKVSVLAEALVRAVGKGRDNELFVLLADLLELDDDLDPLLRAVRVARGRHHQVVLICPWPPGLELPSAREGRNPKSERKSKTKNLILKPEAALWDEVTTRRFHLAYQRMRRTFARLGVTVLCAAEEEPASLILNRLERLRTLGRPHS